MERHSKLPNTSTHYCDNSRLDRHKSDRQLFQLRYNSQVPEHKQIVVALLEEPLEQVELRRLVQAVVHMLAQELHTLVRVVTHI
jgi:hypothetical protein